MAAVSGNRGLDISLAALQRQDPYIFRIVDVASQVALYTFSQRDNEWEKTDVEGTLFIYARSASPRHGFTIMNRLNVENRTEPITKDLDLQLQDPFLLYRNAQLSIYGIWFYDEVECQRIAELMKNLTQLEQLKAQQEVGSPIASQKEAVDIVQMLFKAEHEYNKIKLSSEPKQMTSSNLIRNSSNLIKPIPIKLTDFGADTHYQQVQQQNKAISPRRIPATVVPSLLMSPTVFTQALVGKPMIGVEASAILLPQTDTIMAPKQLHSGLHSPAQMAELTNKKTHVLTKIQLQETLLYLLQNDPNFVNAIYEAYLTGQSNTSAEKKT
ncbi:mRNA-decapping enzyme 1B isoform X8 [Rhincodon typus]|uniref:mRNA-decapping enzyme 1B isoform X8 n=1 Tax=Rhincodon typus TaxID=259920 RepID=UPI00202EF645|nr:mRNA-decapping enzyme 1B isoform X8 [Rhincodon typus]